MPTDDLSAPATADGTNAGHIADLAASQRVLLETVERLWRRVEVLEARLVDPTCVTREELP
ncbi:hypothetical protein [Nocardioides sp.]|uniref:hypothetical protein n=1 Tax=Nocardioides sp. TaxID=35761 RepID=UPI0031FE9ED6